MKFKIGAKNSNYSQGCAAVILVIVWSSCAKQEERYTSYVLSHGSSDTHVCTTTLPPLSILIMFLSAIDDIFHGPAPIVPHYGDEVWVREIPEDDEDDGESLVSLLCTMLLRYIPTLLNQFPLPHPSLLLCSLCLLSLTYLHQQLLIQSLTCCSGLLSGSFL